jgi:hypothetical protein
MHRVVANSTSAEDSGCSPVFERHFSPENLAELWGLSGDTIRRLFEKESGVLVIERSKTARGRRYRTMRIPASVALRVHRRLTNPLDMLSS